MAKKNTKVNKKGCQAWRDMVESYLADREAFLKRHHKRSRVEGIYSSLKRRAQRRELLCRVIVYNIGIVNLSSSTSGGTHHPLLQLQQAIDLLVYEASMLHQQLSNHPFIFIDRV